MRKTQKRGTDSSPTPIVALTVSAPSAMTPDRACIRLCVKRGSKYGLWSGNHVYVLKPQSEASKFAGDNVHVVGNISNDVITIKSIVPIPVTASQEKP
jgi:hypothetical protein